MRFHSVMAILEFQKYVIARTVWAENILVSGSLVLDSTETKLMHICGSENFGMSYSQASESDTSDEDQC